MEESAGGAAAGANIDCGSREACSTEDQKEAPQENASFFSDEASDQHSKQKCEERHWPTTGKHLSYPRSMADWSHNDV